MLGGGVWVTQNKILPGSYINFVNTATASANLGERGIVAIALNLGKAPGTVIEVTRSAFYSDSQTLIGKTVTAPECLPLREIFQNAIKVYVYDLGSSGTVTAALNALEAYEFNVLCAYTATSADLATYVAKVKSWRDDTGKKCQLVVYNYNTSTDHEGIINVVTTVSDYSVANFTGNGSTTAFTVTDKPSTVTVYVNGEQKTASTHYTYASATGVVTFVTAPADGDVIEVRYNPVASYALTAWLAGAEAGCKVNSSCTNMKYNGELTPVCDKTQSQLETCITSGQIAFHLVYGDVCVLEDINSLVTTSATKGDDFKSNQTIRVCDQIANDIAKLFNVKYLGKIPNNASGRESLWSDIVKHHRELESMEAIENFDATLLTVEQGVSKKAIVVNDVITVVNAMSQLYMTVVVQ